MEDALLWKNFLDSDQKAFEALFTKYYKVLYRYGFKSVRNRQLLDDCIQDLFFELWTGRENLGELHSVKSYLFKSLKYKLNREVKRDLKYHGFEEEPEHLLEISYESLIIEEQTVAEKHEKLAYYVGQLTKRQQEAIYLRFYNQFSYEEIAEIMSVSYQGVINLIYKSVKFLREHLLFLLALLLFR